MDITAQAEHQCDVSDLFDAFGSRRDQMIPICVGETWSSLFSPVMQMPQATDTSKNNLLIAIWTSTNYVKLTHKINYHTGIIRKNGKELI